MDLDVSSPLRNISDIKDSFKKIIKKENKPDVIIFDLGLSTFQLQDYTRGFSFKSNEKIDMQMGLSEISAEDVINKLDEKNLKLIIKILLKNDRL